MGTGFFFGGISKNISSCFCKSESHVMKVNVSQIVRTPSVKFA